MAARILGMSTSDDIAVAPERPYYMNNNIPTIEMTRPTLPIVAMCYIHENVGIPSIPQEQVEEAQETINDDEAGEDAIAAAKTVLLCKQMFDDRTKYSNWYLILVGSTQVRELTPANLEQYGKMTGYGNISQSLLRFLKYWAANQETLADNPDVRSRFESNKFFEYHTSATTTPRLCLDAIEETKDLGVFTAEEIVLVDEALEGYTEIDLARSIPKATLVKTRAVLEAAGTLPDIWYMGQRAKDSYSGSKYSVLVKMLKAYTNKKYNVENIGDMSQQALAKKISELLPQSNTRVEEDSDSHSDGSDLGTQEDDDNNDDNDNDDDEGRQLFA